jgi:cytochrome o ubiquinol oxidase subunit 2
VKASDLSLTKETYGELAAPSQREPVRLYSAVAPGLYEAILQQTAVVQQRK